ncbi:type 1 glutamine amidotransferase domain-containing protein [Christiangramia sp. OXR-203]|jgi:putative intracellular protease/amidase|uniref:type 1 glutamine amidotransferase domain-containing protein n=1 Tax=Christiangramia sp. OXR-203 TaxID=3100176 RepID=UPI002AC8F378|nr:type 1 glutamine amidotransferase domain-containing protein [Christiangramia sp. OXR-203]WPY99771.1 type 1 glutamine amidotransferase domain-containing protein [Christiangramia sp. OXR-203]
MKVLFVLTSHDELGDTGNKTGFWIEEFANPYYSLLDKGVEITVATPEGGKAPIDPTSDSEDNQTEDTRRFKDDEAAQKVINNTHKLSDVKEEDFDGIFYPGGHGPLWDLSNDEKSIKLIESFNDAGKPIAFVCHAPAALKNVKAKDGNALVKGKKVTGFTNSEEEAVQLTDVVPFLVEDMLKENGGIYSKEADWNEYAVTDGNLITGQNPQSSGAVASRLYEMLK